MSYIIGMVSQKGGAGKSTLARLFARELAKDGFSVKIADLDTQHARNGLRIALKRELSLKFRSNLSAISKQLWQKRDGLTLTSLMDVRIPHSKRWRLLRRRI